MEDSGEVHSDIIQGSDEAEDAEEVRELYEEVDLDVVSGSDAEMVQGLDAEDDDERMCKFYEEGDSHVVPGVQSASHSESLSSEKSDSASDSESTSGFWRFVRAVYDYRFEYALAVFKPEFAGMRMVPNKRSLHLKHDVHLPLPLHWLLVDPFIISDLRADWLLRCIATSFFLLLSCGSKIPPNF